MAKLNKFIMEELNKDDFRVAIFGSARIKPTDPTYKMVFKLAKEIAKLKADVVTGGGPGLMDAASAGFKSIKGNNGDSIGLNIRLPHEQYHNRHLDMYQNFDTFSDRLDTFVLLSNVAVIAPGGVGTCLEFFYVWQLIQVAHTCKIPIIMMGDMWKELMKWVKKYPLKNGLISAENLDPIVNVNTCEEAIEIIKHAHKVYLENPDACLNINVYGKRLRINEKKFEI
jgi:uncharacterized protein (TIGR00730 family)